MEEKKKTIRIKAGDVIEMKYTGESKPCEYGIGLVIVPVSIVNGECGSIRTIYAMNAETGEFLPGGESYNVNMDVQKAKLKNKAWYFEKLAAHVFGEFGSK